MRHDVSRAEWDARVDLAACYRLLQLNRMADHVYTHATCRVPGEEGRFLINAYGLTWDEVTASNLVKIGVDGEKAEDSPHRVNPAGFTIHSALHMARHDAVCVIHTHTVAGMAVAALADGLLPLSQIAMQYTGTIAYHGYEGIALDLDERERIVADMGQAKVLFLRNHGLLTVGSSVAEAYSLMHYVNLACEVQLRAQATGAKLVLPPEDVRRKVSEQNEKMSHGDNDLSLEWNAHLRRLDRLDPSYKD